MQAFKVFGCLALYLILAGISCWATERSLAMVLPQGWPEIFVWGITIAFFIMASLGSAWLVQSLGGNDFVEKRKLKLWGGLLLVVIFWLLMSLPTNTHTFYFNDKIAGVVTKEIDQTNKYLDQIVIKGSNKQSMPLDSVGKELYTQVNALKYQADIEFHGKGPSGRRGDGEVVRAYITQINEVLGSKIPFGTAFNSTDESVIQSYKRNIDSALNDALAAHTITRESVAHADSIRSSLSKAKTLIAAQVQTSTLDKDVVKQINSVVKDGYNIIGANKAFVNFDSKTDSLQYTADPQTSETNIEESMSVFKVFFGDFLGGRLPASFWYYVLLAILVDIAAFIFFDIFYAAAFSNNKF